MSICFKEKLKIPPETLSSIIASTDNDIRLTLNHLSVVAAGKDNLNINKKYIKMVMYYKSFIYCKLIMSYFFFLGSMGCFAKGIFCRRTQNNEY